MRVPRAVGTVVALTALAAAGCGEKSSGDRAASRGGPPELAGTVPLATAKETWSLLAVPRDGGTVQARSVEDPSRVLWEGAAELPPLREVHFLDGPLVVGRTAAGEVIRYDPRTDRTSTIEGVGEGSVWSGWGGYGVFAAGSGGGLLEVGPEGSRRYDLAASPLWSSPVASGRVAVLVEADGERQIWLLAPGGEGPEATARGSFRSPGLTTAWGRRLALATDGGLTLLDVPSLSPAGDVELEAAPSVLDASPSSHEIYAGLADPPSIVRANRFTGQSRRMTRLPRPPRAMRPAVLGDFLLVDDGGEPLLVPLDGSATERLPGSWRSDLPLGTPDGRVLMEVEGALRMHDPSTGTSTPVEAPAGRWWAAVPWNPNPPEPVASSAPVERAEGERIAGDSAAPSPDSSPPAVMADSGAEESGIDGPPTGFYAVVTAARDPDGVRRLLASLREAGYPTELQQHIDDAGRTWYRGLVGRYASREDAEAAARQLERERDLNAWVTEVRTAAGGEEVFR